MVLAGLELHLAYLAPQSLMQVVALAHRQIMLAALAVQVAAVLEQEQILLHRVAVQLIQVVAAVELPEHLQHQKPLKVQVLAAQAV